jgi:GTPase SAR1 family protein
MMLFKIVVLGDGGVGKVIYINSKKSLKKPGTKLSFHNRQH